MNSFFAQVITLIVLIDRTVLGSPLPLGDILNGAVSTGLKAGALGSGLTGGLSAGPGSVGVSVAAKVVPSLVGSAANAIGESAVDGVVSVGKTAAAGAADVVSNIGAAADGAVSLGADAVGTVLDGVTSVSGNAAAAAGAGGIAANGGAAVGGTTSTGGAGVVANESFGSKIGKGITNGASKLYNHASDLFSTAVQQSKGLVGKVVDAGESIFSSIINPFGFAGVF